MRIPRFVQLPRSRARVQADVDAEIAFDIEMRARDLVAIGLTEVDAAERARREFGDIDGTRDYCEEIDMQIETEHTRANLVEDLVSDLAIAWRAMRRAPAFAATVLLTLALGIGANTAIFSIVRKVLIAPLPYRAPEQLYRLYTATPDGSLDGDMLSAAELAMLSQQSKSIAGLTGFGSYQGFTYTDERTAEPWQTASVDSHFFDVLGVRPALGRAFTPDDYVRGAPHVVILGYPIWQRVFGGDRGVVGKTIQLSGTNFTVVGVLPRNFVGPTFDKDALVTFDYARLLAVPRMAQSRMWRSVVRLRAGTSPAQLNAELATLRPRFAQAFPEMKNAGAILPMQLHSAIVGGVGPMLVVVMIGALVVLLITCVNIAGLFLARAAARRRELGVRAALGAGRARLIRQVLTESVLYGVLGGAAGLMLAFVLKGVLVRATADLLPQMGEAQIDLGVLAFAAAVSIACGLAFGFMPALTASRVDVRESLSESGGRAASQSRAGARGARVIVSGQVACAVVLIVAAGLLTRTFVSLVRTDLGYTATRQQLTFMVELHARLRDPAARGAFMHTLLDRLHRLPGVKSVGYAVLGPWNGGWTHVGFRVEGQSVDPNAVPQLEYSAASPEYFAAQNIPLRMGRGFLPSDRVGSPPVVVVSERVARRFWPNASPIGARVLLDTGSPSDSIPREVVGVVGDVRPQVTADFEPTIYASAEQLQIYGQEVVMRTDRDASTLIPAVKATFHALDPKLPVINPRTTRDVLSESVGRQQFAMALMMAFAGLALLLAALGVYGIMAYAVVARTREFGIRAALGASRRSILLLVLRQGLSTAGLGLVVGLALSAAATRLLASLLVGVSTRDTITYAAASLVLAIVAVVACLLPARAATRVDPVDALRLE